MIKTHPKTVVFLRDFWPLPRRLGGKTTTRPPSLPARAASSHARRIGKEDNHGKSDKRVTWKNRKGTKSMELPVSEVVDFGWRLEVGLVSFF